MKLLSKQDSSVNWVTGDGRGGFFETRFVQRHPSYFTVYVSCQSACNHGCKFCHLTTTKQVRPVDNTLDGLNLQVSQAMEHSKKEAPDAELVHFNFMARGEPMDSKLVLGAWERTAESLYNHADDRDVRHKVLVSTIMPKGVEGRRLSRIFHIHYPEIYYSIYSMDPAFRHRWIPRALPAEKALDALAQWQHDTNKIPKLHFAFIKGENDDYETIYDICHAVNARGLRVDVNIVRYNPAYRCSEESDYVDVRASQMKELLPTSHVNVVKRVGHDVFASCGMFVDRSISRVDFGG